MRVFFLPFLFASKINKIPNTCNLENSIKIYDRNGILALEEIRAIRSPIYINTVGLSLGRVYSIRATAYYIDPNEGIKNTKVTSRDFVAEKAPENNTLMATDYKSILNLGFEQIRDYKDENIIYPELTENLIVEMQFYSLETILHFLVNG